MRIGPARSRPSHDVAEPRFPEREEPSHMSTGAGKHTKSRRDHVADLDPTTRWTSRFWHRLSDGDLLIRMGLCLAAAVILLLVTRAWLPPLVFREGDVPRRAITARTDFRRANAEQTRRAREQAMRQARRVYRHDPEPIRQLRGDLKNTVVRFDPVGGEKEISDDDFEIWKKEFYFTTETSPKLDDDIYREQLEQFRQALIPDGALAQFETAVAEALRDVEQNGLLAYLIEPDADDGVDGNADFNQLQIRVYPIGNPENESNVAVEEVLLADVLERLPEKLKKTLQSDDIVARVDDWLKHKLPSATTLTLDPERTAERRRLASNSVEEVYDVIRRDAVLVAAGTPIDAKSFELIRLEHEAYSAQLSRADMLARWLGTLGMYAALYTLCGFFIHFRYPDLLKNLGQFVGLLAISTATVVLCYWANYWSAEMVPLLLFSMTVAIAFNRELALLLAASLGVVVVLSLGQGLTPFVILMAAAATAILMLGQVRSRTKLTYVGFCVGLVAALTTIGVSVVDSQSLGLGLIDAGYFALAGIFSGIVMMACLLPVVEKVFGVITDISLLELGDAAHPLLQELVRRAPGTYNHSINVASLAEAAAESIGAHGLLVRVGAYFHDIGKIFKPQYFVENQTQGDNRHESLVPAMSTLIIIAHVKDGADLARQHRLPVPIIDFILQHHGTTLVEYFYKRASEQCETDPDAADVDENTFRYPGPKPQTREAGILMLADAVESASRVLVEPTPARIESLIEELTMKRLLDGQLDESGLTLQEVRTVRDSLAKSLTAVYHGRVKYPDQRTA
ncbi:MAG: HDIG domain-containing protein [Planctomycetota bacterium]|nr:MAG: HDIG domain-containing protein [Planctomycetota bacterium]